MRLLQDVTATAQKHSSHLNAEFLFLSPKNVYEGLISPSLIIFASVTAANYALNDAHCTYSTVSVVCL